jgi:ferric-dicitrate binding protein FerR (iron transport regulator)
MRPSFETALTRLLWMRVNHSPPILQTIFHLLPLSDAPARYCRYGHFSIIPKNGNVTDCTSQSKARRHQDRESGGIVMKAVLRVGYVVLACALLPSEVATSQPANMGCVSENSTFTTQTIRCKGGLTIVVENGARYTLRDRDGNGRVDSIELTSKALLLEVPKGRNEFKVITPQAIAAVRGTRWAVDVAETQTSVFVVNGQVAVGRRARGNGVTLGAGEGVDVAAVGPLTVKRWPPARVAALMARLGQ